MVAKFIFSVIRPFQWYLLGTVFISLVWAVDTSLTPYLMKLVVDHIQAGADYQKILIPCLGILIFGFIVSLFYRLWDFFWLKIKGPLKKNIGEHLMSKLLDQSYQFYQDHFAGSISNKLRDVMLGVPDLLSDLIDRVLSYLLLTLVALGTIWTVNSTFAALFTVWVITFMALSFVFGKNGARLSMIASENRSRSMGLITDILTNISMVRLFTKKRFEQESLAHSLTRFSKAEQGRSFYYMKMFFILSLTYTAYLGVSLWLLLEGFKAGTVTAGDFVLILSISMSIVHCLWDFSRVIRELSEFYGQIKQGLVLLMKKPSVLELPNAKPLHIERGQITFDQVGFHYPNSPWIFRDFSITIQAGEKVGIVGYSGGGKSTFINLLLRHFDLQKGKVCIDGQDISQGTLHSLYQNIGVIPQDPVLFHRTLKENIAYGCPTASESEIEQAARKGYAHEFIAQLPEGYNALVGDRGIKLSGGQRQRIAIARVFLKNPPILVLDEATSQLDSITESAIQKSLWELMQGKTTLVIAHRLSTLLHMDRILVFDKGKIVQDGSHEQLIQQDNLYKTLWDTQIEGFLGKKS